MNCEQYREAFAAEPGKSSAEAAAHVAQCAECAAFRSDILLLDKLIGRALEISVPELRMPELAPVEDDAAVATLPFRRISAPVWLGLAASLVIAAVLGIRLLTSETDYATLETEILAHLDHEPQALLVTNTAVSAERLHKVVSANADMDTSPGLVTYATKCVINGHIVPHLVIQGEHGPVTILLLAEEMIEAPVPIDGEGVRGIILPVGSGSIAVIGERDETLEKIEQQVVSTVHWKT
ncbi:MAG: DUF3379 domain-containing protein [Woeseiaceae bacterium]|nr:DUF3379 domain-containing protein [Woeseiaceae bacterium]